MTSWLIGYAAAIAVFLILDMLWLGFIASNIYRPALEGLLLEQIRLVPAILFYVIYAAGVLVLAVAPAVERGSLMTALLLGALLGLVAYATYDLSNAATLKLWPAKIVVIDVAWGTLLTAATSAAAYLAIMAFGSRAS